MATHKNTEGHTTALMDPSEEDMLKVLCDFNGVNYNAINILIIDPSVVHTLLFVREVDMGQGCLKDILAYAQLNNIPLNTIRCNDYGVVN